MLRNLQQVDNTEKAGAPGKLRSHVSEGDLEDACDDDLAWSERVPASHFHMWPLPKANGGGDLTATNTVAEGPKELHDL
jgi:hypothetical protein